MIGLVYVCNGKIKGYTFPITVTAMEEKDQRTFIKNMIEEGALDPSNVMPQDRTVVSWGCIVFDCDGKPIWNYIKEFSIEGKLFKVNVEQTEGT